MYCFNNRRIVFKNVWVFLIFRSETMKRKINIGDKVICGISGVIGIVEKFYYPTACKEQTMIICADGRRYHAPTDTFYKI